MEDQEDQNDPELLLIFSQFYAGCIYGKIEKNSRFSFWRIAYSFSESASRAFDPVLCLTCHRESHSTMDLCTRALLEVDKSSSLDILSSDFRPTLKSLGLSTGSPLLQEDSLN